MLTQDFIEPKYKRDQAFWRGERPLAVVAQVSALLSSI
jgi:hypothetical protein